MKKNIAIICGGQSVEHDVSLMSASNVIRDLDTAKFNKIVIYITTQGQWLLAHDVPAFIVQAGKMRIDTSSLDIVMVQPGNTTAPLLNSRTKEAIAVDCFFPVLHGALGEDGTMQGFFEVLDAPYVGCGCLGSAISMEKNVCKQLFRAAGIPTLDWVSVHVSEKNKYSYAELAATLAPVFFMKTVRSGSSIGVLKIRNETEYTEALKTIFDFDNMIIIEKGVVARELEVSVLGNDDLRATPPGEVLVYDDFYTYDAKYFNPNGSATKTPADVSPQLSKKLQELAIKTARAVCCTGMARVDFLVVSDDEIYLNEINTLPGFTNISMYPKNWLAQGMSYAELLSQLVELAFEAFADKQRIQRNYAQFVADKRKQYGDNVS